MLLLPGVQAARRLPALLLTPPHAVLSSLCMYVHAD
jgi:hypothetical protein